MAKIKFENGVVVNFDGNPTPQDVEEVANKLGLNKTAQPTENKNFGQQLIGDIKEGVGGALKGMYESQKSAGEISGVLPFARELIRPPVSFVRGIQGLMGNEKKAKAPVNIPFIGEVKPSLEMKPLESAESALNVGAMLPLAQVAKGLPKLSVALKNNAVKLYESLLKPSKAVMKKSPDVVKTALKEGIKITRGGQAKVKAMIETLSEEVDNLIAEGKAAGKNADIMKLESYITDLKKFYSDALGGEEIIKEIDNFAIDVIKPKLEKFGRYIPIEEAQKIKQATYKLSKKFYDKLAPVKEEVRKTLARGLKDDIASQIEGAGDINARSKTLIELQPAINDAVNRLSKHDILGLKDILVIGSELATTKGKSLGIPTLIWKTLSSPWTKSTIALKLNKLSDLAAKDMRAGKTATALVVAKVIDYFNNLNEE